MKIRVNKNSYERKKKNLSNEIEIVNIMLHKK